MKGPLDILGLLQNPWYPCGDPRRCWATYDRHALRNVLFSGSMTGRRLCKAFGQSWFMQIWWDNASPIGASHSAGVSLPNPRYIRDLIERRRPLIVLTFGRLAEQGLDMAFDVGLSTRAFQHFPCHHPNARHFGQADLDLFAEVVRDYCINS